MLRVILIVARRPFYLREQRFPQPASRPLVERDGRFEFLACGAVEDEWLHRRRARSLANTASAGSPEAHPVRTSSSRRASSASQATSASGSAPSSREPIKKQASSARSSEGSCSSWVFRVSAAKVM